MSFKLEIRLDRPDGVYLAGDMVSGVVTVHDPDGGRGKIQLIREWRAHGKGSGDHGARAEQTIAETWGAGSSEVPFSFTMPDGPFTYRGTYTNLDWYVRAESGGLFGKTKAETDFIFGAMPNMPSVDFGPTYAVPKPVPQIATKVGYLGAMGCGVFLIGLIAGLVFLIQPPAIIALLIGGFILGLGGFVIYTMLRNQFAQAKLGNVQLTIEPIIVQASKNIQIRFATTTQAEFELEKIEVKLVQNEIYATGSGTNRSVNTKKVLEQISQVSEARAVRRGENIEFNLEMAIPAEAATTFMAADNQVQWQVIVTIPIKGWSDWEHIQNITVTP